MYDMFVSFNMKLFEFCEGGLVLWIYFCKYYKNYGFGEVVNIILE